MSDGLITVFGGSGFIGRYLVKRLAATGRPIRIATRDPEAGLFLKPMGAVGQIDLVLANLRDEASVARAVAGAAQVVNLVGVLAEHGKQTFAAVHAEGAARVARASLAAGAAQLVHGSALGASPDAGSAYARSKADGEAKVRAAFPGATIVRPSIVFGAEDGFLNRFGALARLSPVLPVFGGGGGTRFQPVYVADVAEAIFRILQAPERAQPLYELAGPEVLTLRQVLELVLRETRRRRWIAGVPYGVGSLCALAARLPFFPKPLRITADQLRALRTDVVARPGVAGLADLGIVPTPIATIAPLVLSRYRRETGPAAR